MDEGIKVLRMHSKRLENVIAGYSLKLNDKSRGTQIPTVEYVNKLQKKKDQVDAAIKLIEKTKLQ